VVKRCRGFTESPAFRDWNWISLLLPGNADDQTAITILKTQTPGANAGFEPVKFTGRQSRWRRLPKKTTLAFC